MKQSYFKVISNKRIAKNVYEMKLEGDTSPIICPGQFVNIKIESEFLRRPISICDYDDTTLTLIYKVVGKGTSLMSAMQENTWLDILIALGNGFNTNESGENPVLIGGGVGVPPMFKLAKELIQEGKDVSVILGFNTKSEIFYEEEFKALGVDVYCSTADGSFGTKGFVTDVIRNEGLEFDYLYTCGPLPMLKALYDATTVDGEYSFEERMGCGFGACMGCTCKTKYGNKRICKDGPVLKREEIIW